MAVDIGNGCDVGLVDALEFYERQEVIRVVQCHIESVENGRAFMEAAARVSRKKPVIVLKAGRSEAGQSAAASHSGAAAGEAQLYAAAFAKAGIVTAHSAEEMRMLSKAFCSLPLPQGKRVAVFSFSGGGAVLAIDALEDEGLELAELSPSTLEKIQAYFPDWMVAHNPLTCGWRSPPATSTASIPNSWTSRCRTATSMRCWPFTPRSVCPSTRPSMSPGICRRWPASIRASPSSAGATVWTCRA